MNLFDNKVGVAEWYPLLNWEVLPDFGPCHHHAASGELDEFMQRYVVTDDLKRFCGTILEKLVSKRAGQPVVVLEGDPGIGKTTLVYSLSAHVTSNAKLNESYVFYACHANNIDNDDWEREVLYHVKQAFKQLFISCSQKARYDKICSNEGDSKKGLRKQINRLKTCLSGSEHRHKFNKTLVFVLDNVDTVTVDERVLESFELINKILEPSIIKKWFVVRPETIDRYSSSQRKRIESFVSDHLVMPSVSLYDVVEKRVQETAGSLSNKINPFSKELCDDLVLPFCQGNIRKGLSVLEGVIRDVQPKGFEGKVVSEKVIQNYIRKSAVPTLFNEKLIKNLHSIEYSSKSLETPMAYDLLSLCRFSSDSRTLLSMLYDAIDRRNVKMKYIITGRENKYTIYDHEFEKLIKYLVDDGLVNWNKQSGTVLLTSLGNAYIDVSSQAYYSNICREYGRSIRSDTYWSVSRVEVSHASIAKSHSTSAIF